MTKSVLRSRRFELASIGFAASIALACASGDFAGAGSSEARITAGLESWFTSIARSAPASQAPRSGLMTPEILTLEDDGPFKFSLEPGSGLSAQDLHGWVSALRTPRPRVEYRLAGLSISNLESDLYRVRFALEQRSVDALGLAHIARSDHRWRIRVAPGEKPTVTGINFEKQLAFPGTGPMIVCY